MIPTSVRISCSEAKVFRYPEDRCNFLGIGKASTLPYSHSAFRWSPLGGGGFSLDKLKTKPGLEPDRGLSKSLLDVLSEPDPVLGDPLKKSFLVIFRLVSGKDYSFRIAMTELNLRCTMPRVRRVHQF
jgi:hypothetical protein